MGSAVLVLVLSALLLIVLADPLLLAGGATRPDGFRGSLLQKKAATLHDHPLSDRRRLSLSEATAASSTHIKGIADLYYVMELAVGTPPVTVQALFGISDLCWVECTPCSGCNNAAPPAGARLYDRVRTTCSDTECGYRYVYGATDTDRNYVQGILGTETIEFGSNDAATVHSFTFGCTNTVYRNDLFDGNTGVVGLGRSKLSLVGQLGLDRFSYCLASKLGMAAGRVRTRGVAFQIGAPATLLVEPAYTAVVEAFKARMSRTYEAVNGSSLLCFLVNASKNVVTVPTMTMRFDGMDIELPEYFAYTGKQSGGGDVLCLMIGKSRTGSRIGNYMQMDFHVLYEYDLKNSVMSVQPADCSKI
ncbi:aspartic proteinase nepenthesin-1-like [Oryza glaberrima]|uniref:aspartic proteinase nepenthesin-1-like n=1 Tax=Oryza glaberrima TaxID=4538 RepID=UPI00224C298B|nr:aspartic proteinase nepenthesin-1-like [Oryza glaberrima]